MTPRVFFPDKPATESDTVVTQKYTGLDLFTTINTSISIGYLGEFYIDFGYALSLLCTALGGWFFGAGYTMIRNGKGPVLIRFGLCAGLAITFGSFGTALIKIVGGVTTAFIAALVLQYYVLPYIIRTFGVGKRKLGAATPRVTTL